MQALVTTPGVAGSTEIGDVPAAAAASGALAVRALRVGVCGTDREIAAGHFGVAPAGPRRSRPSSRSGSRPIASPRPSPTAG